MKIKSTTPLLAPAAVAVLGMLLLGPIHPAAAGGAKGAKAALGTKVTTGGRDYVGAVGKVWEVCRGRCAPFQATTTGTYSPTPNPIVRDHRASGGGQPGGGVTITSTPRPKRGDICAGWAC